MTEIIFVGTGEACDPDLPNTSLLYRGGRTILLDCGYGVPHALWRFMRDGSAIDAIYLSHTHADHTFGLPGLLLWMREMGRTRPLEILGHEEMPDFVSEMVELAYPGLLGEGCSYPIAKVVLADDPYELGPLVLRTARSDHMARNLAVRIEETGHAVCYSGDGGMTDATRALYRGAKVLVHECYGAAPGTPGHAYAETLLGEADELELETLCLLHLGKPHKVAVAQAVKAYAGSAKVLLPGPGESLLLD